ncbi:L-seryl-tRNA(Sec) selenium transferase [Halobacillus shinanisalinarum]|uniref:L-seryl-tRNA(Sec) selenium transferase n=1 Tax=Halobacillus shinanisalinarum TaxID=2932258 RepID=A0ABY4H4P6_9BACI|nr:L-seryl-tRNA(Sec) selenium transferase [Halobacillus shinanisalinarum]UOQ95443.1 L-seryl-tRNA(Sec) selenium transferase [Halobacillus shinanisalinarum]
MKQYLRQLPPVHELQKQDRFESILAKFDIAREQLTKFVQQEINEIREQILNHNFSKEFFNDGMEEAIFQGVEGRIQQWTRDRLRRVINATGTVLHTNLGRSRLSEKAVQHVADVARNYSNLEYKAAEGKRGSRHDIIEDLLKEVTGAEAAMVVNNNAAAVFLVLSALAKRQEVIVSRGQLVEIGGSFRVSSIMEESGARLVEVGTTNKTHLFDYENAVSCETAMIMKVHTSNFMTVGFTESVDTGDLVNLKNERDLVFYEDLGSGSLYDFKQHGIGDEPVVKEMVDSGVDLISFSGDKLLGGPQAGIIAGNKDLIQKLKKHQLARVLRVDKMTLAALEQTLKSYVLGDAPTEELPTLRDVTRTHEDIKRQAETFSNELQAKTSSYHVDIAESTSQVGGGTMPSVHLPTFVAAVQHNRYSAHELAAKLRAHIPVIVTRIQDGRVCVDFRTIVNEEMPELLEGFLDVGVEQ